MFVSGGLVNPVNKGIEPITNHPISKFVEEKCLYFRERRNEKAVTWKESAKVRL